MHAHLVSLDAVQTFVPAPAPRQSLPSSAMLIVDENLRVVSADAAGRLLLSAERGIRLTLGRLCTGSMMLNNRIRGAIVQGTAVQDLSLPADARGGTRATIAINPMTGFVADDGATPSAPAQAIMLVSMVGDRSEDAILAIRGECGLTGAETEMLRLIFKGLNTVEAASVLGIAKSTARTHLQKIFAKTGTSRQSELVHFVATHGNH